MTKALLIPSDLSMVCSVVEIDDLASMQALVGGRIECVEHPDWGDLWINEEGKFGEHYINERATDLMRDILFEGDYIAGDAFFTGPTDSEGGNTDVKQELVDLLAP